MRTELFRNLITSAFFAGTLCVAQQYPPPQQQPYPPQQQPYPPQQQPYPPQQQQQYPQQAYPQSYPQQPVYNQQQAPPPQSPQQLQQLVGPIALYPDGLLAQVLTASTYSEQLPEAAGWANQHAYIHGDRLADAIRADSLQFPPAIMGLLPFPQTLSYMAQNMGWTEQLGNAVLAQRADVMDAVQFLRYQSYDYGYLRDPQFAQYEHVNLIGPRTIEINPINPGLYYVPVYNPLIVYAPYRGRFVGGAFSFGFGGVQIGAAFAPWGWGGVGFGWREHTILVDHQPWGRTFVNRGQYVHPYAQPYRPVGPTRVEGHDYREERRGSFHEEHHEH